MEHENQTRNSGYNTHNQQWRDERDEHGYGQHNNWNRESDWGANQPNRVNYLPDNDDNRNDRSGGYGGYQQSQNFGQYENDWRDDRRGDGGQYGGAAYGRQQYDKRDGINRFGYGAAGNAYGSDYGSQNFGRGQQGRQYGGVGNSYQKGGYGSSSERYGAGYQGSGQNRYGGDRHYQGGNDRSWWNRTRDEVASWFGDDNADRRREGERHNDPGPYYGKGPRGYQRSQERIKEDVCDRLSVDRALDASNIEVEVQGNDVILSGNVHSKEEKRRAEDLVERISGVKNVENRLRIDRNDAPGTDTWSNSIGL